MAAVVGEFGPVAGLLPSWLLGLRPTSRVYPPRLYPDPDCSSFGVFALLYAAFA